MKTETIENDIYREIDLFLNKQLSINNIKYDIEKNQSGEGDTYFSEIEVTLWHLGNVIDVISVLIYLKGKQRNDKESFINWFKEEYFKSIEKISF